nr:G5 domain-containing protein [Gemella haemolysans]
MKIARTGKTTETKKEVIKFETKEEKDDSKYVDEKVTKVEGKNGEKEVTYNVVREKGKEVSREVASEKVITEATAKVVVVGTKQRTAAQQQEVAAAKQSYAAPAQSYSAPGGSVVLSNGNTAGAEGAAAAQEMARRTGVPASTWEHIIARESNGQVGARNASGASGLFQTMPGWGSTATVQDQINAATRAYQAQGLSAWGMR